MRKNIGTGIYLRGSVYWLNFQRNGVRQFVSLETDDEAKAVERATEIRVAPGLETADTFLREIDSFIAYKRRKKIFTDSSAHGRRYILRAFARWVGRRSPADVTATDVQRFYDCYNAVTANTYLMILRSFFEWARLVARIRRLNPCDSVDVVAEDLRGLRLRDFATEDQRDRLIASCNRADLKFVLYCGFHAGLRKNEIIEARPFWFDLGRGLLHLRSTATIHFKDREERTVPLTAEFHDFLLTYGLREPFMLQPRVKHGRNRYRYDFTRPFMAHVKANKLERIGETRLTPHLMRHTFASLLVSNGVSLYKVAIWLGDNPATVEKRYARLKPNDPDIEKAHSGYSPAVKRSQHASS